MLCRRSVLNVRSFFLTTRWLSLRRRTLRDGGMKLKVLVK